MAREWAIKYAIPTISDLISMNNINSDNLENKYNLLAKQVEKLENDVNLNKSITMQLLQELKLHILMFCSYILRPQIRERRFVFCIS